MTATATHTSHDRAGWIAPMIGSGIIRMRSVPSSNATTIACASTDALILLTPSIGPTSTMILHRVAASASEQAGEWPVEAFARSFGIGVNQLAKNLHRLTMFGLAWGDSTSGDPVASVPATTDLTIAQFRYLPEYLQVWYREQFPHGFATRA